MEKQKTEWKEQEYLINLATERALKKILSNKNSNALEKIKTTLNLALFVIPCAILLMFFASIRAVEYGGFMRLWALIFPVLGLGGWLWANYLKNFIDRIDIGRMSVKEVTEKVNKFYTYLIREKIVIAVLLPIYLIVWMRNSYIVYGVVFDNERMFWYIPIFVVLVSMLLAFRIMKMRYLDPINEVRNNLRDMSEYED
ncbi:MAG: hypothetical protein LBM07_05845 [Culturomica sp.]|nr:hypothetical protein [Culturomica sp.]